MLVNALLSTCPTSVLVITGDAAERCPRGAGDLPSDLGHIGRNAAIDLALEVFKDFGSPLGPLFRRGDLRPILHGERIGHRRHPVIGGRFIKARAGLVVAALAGAKRLDAELIHHVLMVDRIPASIQAGRARHRVRRRQNRRTLRLTPPRPKPAGVGGFVCA